MSIAENKAVALQFFERFSAGEIEGALATMADDATWWIPGKKERSPSAGLYTKDTGYGVSITGSLRCVRAAVTSSSQGSSNFSTWPYRNNSADLAWF